MEGSRNFVYMMWTREMMNNDDEKFKLFMFHEINRKIIHKNI